MLKKLLTLRDECSISGKKPIVIINFATNEFGILRRLFWLFR